MFSMHLNTTELDRWIKNQPNRDRAKKQAMIVMKEKLVEEVKKEVGTHTTTNQLEHSVMGLATDRKIEVYSAGYGDTVLEYGRKPGKFPPIEPLNQWAALKLGDARLGYLVARKIARSGTEKFRKGGPKQLSAIEKRFNENIMPNQMRTLLNEYTK